jgi:uncharacterized protein YceK
MKCALLFLGTVVVFTTAFVGPGCATAQNQKRNPPRIYGGVREDFKTMGAYPIFVPCILIFDLPFTIVGDTVTLPFDIHATVTSTNSQKH